MHEKVKDFLHKTGTSHTPGHMGEETGHTHAHMHEIEGKHFEGKKHHHEAGL